MTRLCDVYWGSHGCNLERGHEGTCVCECCDCDPHYSFDDDRNDGCVGRFPYYGPETKFYGDDAASRGLPPYAQV